MKIELVKNRNYIVIEREITDPKVYSDSRLWYMIRNKLISMGHDVIKKLMWKDGNLVSDDQHYVRSRKFFKSNDSDLFMLNWGNHLIRSMYPDWNDRSPGKVFIECHWNKEI